MDIGMRIGLVAATLSVGLAVSAQVSDDRLCADQNGDGMVTPADFSAWVSAFNAGSWIADVNQDGNVTPADFSAWVSAFNLGSSGPGCPVELGSGIQVQGSISYVGDTDVFYIDADAGEDIRLAISEPGAATSLSPYVAIYAPNGDLVTSSWDYYGFDLTAANVPFTGRYSIVVRDISSDDVGLYRFTAIVPDNVVDVGNIALPSGTSITQTVDLGDIDTYTIQADAGDDIRIAISEPGSATGFSPYVLVYAPNGDLVTSTWDYFGFDLTAANVPYSGTYTIVVQDVAGDAWGSYTITAVVPDGDVDVDNVALPSGTSLTQTVALGDIDTFTIQADAGDDIRVAISEPGSATGFSPFVAIYSPNGDLVTSNWDYYGLALTAPNVPMSGTFTIVVQDVSGDAWGNYTITAVVPDVDVDVDNIALPSGTSTTQTIELGDIDTYTIQADAGDDIRVAVCEPGVATGFSPFVAIYAPNGDLVTSDWEYYGLALTASNVPMSGTFTIVVQDIAGDAWGTYTITAVVPDGEVDVGNIALPSGTTTTQAIDLGDIDTYTVNASFGNDLTIGITEPGTDTGLAPFVAIYASNGDRLTSTWDYYSLTLTAVNVPYSGTYTIVVQDADGDASGLYEVSSLVTP